MAVPGSPLDPRARGANRLLRDGAALIESVEDVLDILSGLKRPRLEEPSGWEYDSDRPDPNDLDAEVQTIREQVASLLSPSPVSRDELARQTGAPTRVVLAALVELELAGRCEIWPNGMVTAAYPGS
jgi:DNA processing protein